MNCIDVGASAQVASAIESGVAQAAALATSMSADELAAKLQKRKQSVLASGSSACPGSPAGVHCLFSEEGSSMASASTCHSEACSRVDTLPLATQSEKMDYKVMVASGPKAAFAQACQLADMPPHVLNVGFMLLQAQPRPPSLRASQPLLSRGARPLQPHMSRKRQHRLSRFAHLQTAQSLLSQRMCSLFSTQT